MKMACTGSLESSKLWRPGRHSAPLAAALLLLALFATHCNPVTSGVPGALDAAFGTAGKVTTSFGGVDDEAFAVAVQPDGKVIAAGRAKIQSHGFDFAIARYGTDGSLDPTFGGSGKVTTDLGLSDEIRAIALTSDGRIVAAGTSGEDSRQGHMALVRYESDGSLDSSFGENGRVGLSFGPEHDAARAVLIAPDGGILVAGEARVNGTYQFAVARLTPNGSLDDTFGRGQGEIAFPVGHVNDRARAIALQRDGKILVAGSAVLFGHHYAAIARLLPSGDLDGTFGTGGFFTSNVGASPPAGPPAYPLQSEDELYGVFAPTALRILAGGSTSDGWQTRFEALALLPNGVPDAAFGTYGQAIADLGAGITFARAMAVRPDGSLVIAGSHAGSIALQSFRSTGAIDTVFGRAGVTLVKLSDSSTDRANAVVVEGSRHVIAAGSSSSGGVRSFAVVRVD